MPCQERVRVSEIFSIFLQVLCIWWTIQAVKFLLQDPDNTAISYCRQLPLAVLSVLNKTARRSTKLMDDPYH